MAEFMRYLHVTTFTMMTVTTSLSVMTSNVKLVVFYVGHTGMWIFSDSSPIDGIFTDYLG